MDGDNTSSLGLTKVVLYKHGIGYFERRGKAIGPTRINLVCEASEIDDMLKSLLALAGKGRIDAVTYDSSKTLKSRLAEFGFDISTSQGLGGLISQMKGIPVTVTASGETVSGRVIGMDLSEQLVNEHILKEQQLVLYTPDSSFKRIALSAVSNIKVDDEAMASELKQQLELLFQNAKKKDRKSLSVILGEEGEHELLIAYSIPCPIWKTSYRLVMHDSQRVLLQGMAIVDNVQEEDWNDVQIVLVSASPISFIQPLYDPVLPPRARIAAQGTSSSGPVTAERARRMPAPGQAPAPMMAQAARGGAAADSWEAAAEQCSAAPFLANRSAPKAMPTGQALDSMMVESFSEELKVETAEKGELFEYRINRPVTIPRNSSALIPIVQQDIEGERISLYNEAKNARFPHAAIRFLNNTGLTLEGGPVTVMEGDIYAGEALLDTTKPDDKRFLLYAVDQSCPVRISNKTHSRPYWRVRALHGTIYLDFRLRNEKHYEFENLSDTKKTIYVEHPLNAGWNLIGEPVPSETTQNYYRFALEAEAKKSIRLIVNEESDAFEQVYIYDPGNLEIEKLDWLCGQNFVDAEFVRFIKQLVEKKSEVYVLQTELAQQQQLLKQYTEDQARARENLRTLGVNNERYRKVIDTTEDQIGAAKAKIQDLLKEHTRQLQLYEQLAMNNLSSQNVKSTFNLEH